MSTQDLPLTFADGALTYVNRSAKNLLSVGVADGVILPAFAAKLSQLVDQRAETLRGTLMTPGVGQAMEYQEVTAEATAALSAPTTATAALYPMLASSIGIDVDPTTKAPAVDVLGVARAVLATQAAWLTAGAAVRKARLAGKTAIAAATTCAAAAAAHDAIVWPTL